MSEIIKPNNIMEYYAYRREWAYRVNELSTTLKFVKGYIAEQNNIQHALLRHIKLGLDISQLQSQTQLASTNRKLRVAREEYLALKFDMRFMFSELKEERIRKKAEWLTDEQRVARIAEFWKKQAEFQIHRDLTYKGQDGTNFW